MMKRFWKTILYGLLCYKTILHGNILSETISIVVYDHTTTYFLDTIEV